jgi:hypothetical protein
MSPGRAGGERPLPWTPLLKALGEQRFETLDRALKEAGTDELSRDAFLLNGEAGQLLRDLVAEDAPPESVNACGALLHLLYLAWARDWPVAEVGRDSLREVLISPPPISGRPGPPAVCYVQLPLRMVWAEPTPGRPHEPLDGLFVLAVEVRVSVVAVLDFRGSLEEFTTMEAALALPAPAPESRPDGSRPFASLLPAGDRAGLFSVADTVELAALGLLALAAAESAA